MVVILLGTSNTCTQHVYVIYSFMMQTSNSNKIKILHERYISILYVGDSKSFISLEKFLRNFSSKSGIQRQVILQQNLGSTYLIQNTGRFTVTELGFLLINLNKVEILQ